MSERGADGRFVSGTVTGSETVARQLDAATQKSVMPRLRTAIRALGLMLENKVKLEKLNGQVLNRRSGRLARSINTRFKDTPTSSTANIGTSLLYGRIWELTGSREFRIFPKNKKALFWAGAAHPVRSVLHPAQSPRPFLRTALDEMRPTIRATIDAALKPVALR